MEANGTLAIKDSEVKVTGHPEFFFKGSRH